jgi:hypothetical protein
LIDWWNEIFEVPCVALDAATEADTTSFIRAGADLIGVALAPGQSVADVADRVRDVGSIVRSGTPA